jgi:uncharacterized protein YbjT (DUF2867 family)
MYIILGGTGHIGSELARLLLDRGERVTVVMRSEKKRGAWEARGARVAVVDVHDVEALRRVFREGRRAFLLNPPAAASTDTAAEERKTAGAIVAALEGSGLEKVVAQSTYGARAGGNIGDLTVLYELEQALARQPIPATLLRGAYYLSNWDMSLETARNEGVVHTFFPADFKLPMVAPRDIAHAAARLLTEPVERTGTHHVEGPERYSPGDVAAAFARALGRPVRAEPIPPARWMDALMGFGFSKPAAESMAEMTRVTLDEKYEVAGTPERGTTTLEQYIQELVAPSRQQ